MISPVQRPHTEVLDDFPIPQAVAPEYTSHAQRIFVNFQIPHTSQCRTDTHRRYLKIFKSLHTTTRYPHTTTFSFFRATVKRRIFFSREIPTGKIFLNMRAPHWKVWHFTTFSYVWYANLKVPFYVGSVLCCGVDFPIVLAKLIIFEKS